MTNTTTRPSNSTLLSILNSTTDYSNLSMDQVSIGWGLSVVAANAAKTDRSAVIHLNRAERLAQAATNRGFVVRFGFSGDPVFEKSAEGPSAEWAARS